MAGDFSLPPHAYVPGRTARHDAALFRDEIAEIAPAMTAEALAASRAWRGGWACFNAGFFWEAHELFEPVWMALPPDAPERQLVQGAIQLANAGLKRSMGRPEAVRRLVHLAQAHPKAARAGGARLMEVDLDPLFGVASDLLGSDDPRSVNLR